MLQPIRWHVDAKRYLTATDPEYLDKLSKGSVRSLEVQGGPYNECEVRDFEAIPYYAYAVQLRSWDEVAKSATAIPPPIVS